MSSYDGGGFDEWVQDSFRGLTSEQETALKAVLEPFREMVDNMLESFEPDEMSWRTFRNDIYDLLPQETQDEVDAIFLVRPDRFERM